MLKQSHPIPRRTRSCCQRFMPLAERSQAEEERWGGICLVQKLTATVPVYSLQPSWCSDSTLHGSRRAHSRSWDKHCEMMAGEAGDRDSCCPVPRHVGASPYFPSGSGLVFITSGGVWSPSYADEPGYGAALPKRLMQPRDVRHMWQPVGTQGCSQKGGHWRDHLLLTLCEQCIHNLSSTCPTPPLAWGHLLRSSPYCRHKLAELCSWGTDSRRSWVSQRQCVSYHQSRARRLSWMRNGLFPDQARVAPPVKGSNSPSVI